MKLKAKVIAALGVAGVSWFGWWVSDIPIGYYQFKETLKKTS